MRFYFTQLWGRIKERPISLLWELPSQVLFLISGEVLFLWFPNSGGIVILRSLIASFCVLTIGFWGNSMIEAKFQGNFAPLDVLYHGLKNNGLWYAYTFAAVYAALYARFSSQWQYLAGLYNDLMAKTVDLKGIEKDESGLLAIWWAAFIEDAEMMHLATNKTYGTPIKYLLESNKHTVREVYSRSRKNGEAHLKELERRLRYHHTEH